MSPTVQALPTQAESARHRIERLRAANSAAADLATLLSTAVRIEPLLVRRVRLLLAEADVGAELDLWSSEILASASPLAISFDPACAEELRSDLAGAAYDLLRDRVGDLIAASHAESHWSLRLEERINRLMVGADPAAVQQAERLLYAAIGELRDYVSDPSADPVPIARWLLAALGRIPRAVAATEAGVVAKLSAGTQLDHRFDPPAGTSATLEAWMPWLLATARVEMRTVPVRLPHGYLLVNQPGSGDVTLLVPGTDPMTLYVTWHDGTQAQHERLRFHAREPVSLPIPVDEVTLETLTGERWRLRRRTDGEGTGDLVGGLDFSAARARLRPCLDRVSQLDSVVDAVTRQPPSVVALTGPAGAGKSVLLGAALDRLEGAGYLVVQHFYGIQRTWDTAETVTASLRAKLEAALGSAMAAIAEPPQQAPSTSSPDSVTGTDEDASDRSGFGRRRALVIANSVYEDPSLSSLRSPEADARALADALRDPSVGFYDENVRILLNAPGSIMRSEVEEFFSSVRPDELLLLYFSGHGLVDTDGELLLAATDTTLRSPGRTGISMRFVREALTYSRSIRIVLILDCCEGKTTAALKAASAGQQIAVLSIAMAIDNPVEGPSPFTRLLIEGLRGGQADLDGDGAISVAELYEYTRRRWDEVATGARGPSLSVFGNAGDIILTRHMADEPDAARAGQELATPPHVLPTATLRAAAAAARQAGLHGIVIALDGLPGSSEAEVDRFLLEQSPIAGLLPPGVNVLVSTRNGRGVRYQEAFGTDAVVVDVDDSSTGQVCRMLLEWRRAELTSAFADPAELEELIQFSGGVPGRLQEIIDWAGDQQVGSVRLTDLPPTLSASADMMWDKLEAQGQHYDLGVIAVAGPALTMADLTAIIGKSAVPPGHSPAIAWTLGTCAQLTEALANLRLVRLDGPAEEPGTVVTVSHPSVAAAYADRFVAETTAAHGRHVTAFPYHDPSSAGPYQIASAAYHHVRYGEPGRVARLAMCGGYLDLRQRSAGVDALAADLAELAALAAGSPQGNEAELVRRAVVTSASAARAEPDCFVDLVANGLRAIGAADLAETVFTDWWHPSVWLQAVLRVESAEPMWRQDEPVTAATRWSPSQIASASAGGVRLSTGAAVGWTQPGPYLPQPALMIRWGDRLVVTSGSAVVLTRPEAPPSPLEYLVTGAEVTALSTDDGFLFAGLRDGTVMAFSRGTDSGRDRRTLVGHTAAVTALAKSSAGLLSASEDGTVRVWNPVRDNPLQIYRGHRSAVVALAVLDSGAVISGDDRGRLRWWNPETGADIGVLGGHLARVTAICAWPGAIAMTAGLDGALWRWNLAEPGRPVDLPLRPPGAALLKLAVAAAGTSGADAMVGWTADGVLIWWDPADGTVLQTIRPDGVAEPVHDLFADESMAVLAHAAGLVAYPALPQRDPTGFAKPNTAPGLGTTADAYLGALAHAPDRPSVAIGTASGMASVDLTTGLSVPDGQPGPPAVSMAFTADESLLAVLADGTVRGARTSIGDRWRRVVAEDSPTGPVGAWLQVGDSDLTELAMSVEVSQEVGQIGAGIATGVKIRGLELNARQIIPWTGAEIRSLAAASIDRRWVAAGDTGGIVRLIRPADVPEIDLVRISGGPVTALAFAHSGRWLIAGGADGGICRISLSDAHAVSVIGRHSAAVTGLAIVADSDTPRTERNPRDIHDRVISGSADGKLRLWDVERCHLLGVAAGQVAIRAVASSWRTVTARDAEGRLWVLEVDPYVQAASAADQLSASVTMTRSTDVGPHEVQADVVLDVSARAAVELRAAQVVARSPLRPVPGQRPGLMIDGVNLVLDETGRLTVPRRLAAESPARIAVTQRLRTAPFPGALSLGLTLYSPETGQYEVIFRPPERENDANAREEQDR